MRFLQKAWARRLISALILCIAVALLTTHFSFQELPQFEEGEIASQDVEATIEFDYIDEIAWMERKVVVAEEQPAIYELDISKNITIEHRINKAFSDARTQLHLLEEEPPIERLQAIQIRFEQSLGLELDSVERQQFSQSGWSVDLQQVSLRLLEDSMQFYIIDVASEIPQSKQEFEVHRQFEQTDDIVVLTDIRNVKTQTEIQQYVSILASNLSSYSEDLRLMGAIVARKSIQVNFTYNHAKTQQVRQEKSTNTPPVIRRVNRGQSIVRKGDRVDGTQSTMLKALVAEHGGGVGGFWGEFAVKVGLSAFLLASTFSTRMCVGDWRSDA